MTDIVKVCCENQLLNGIRDKINETIWGEVHIFNGMRLPTEEIAAIVVDYRIGEMGKRFYIDLLQVDPEKWEKIITKCIYRFEETQIFGKGIIK